MKKRFIITILLITLIVSLLIIPSCGSGKKAEENEVIKIGAILPLTGPMAKIGIWHKNGMSFFDLNDNIKITYLDSKGSVKEALSIYREQKSQQRYFIGTLTKIMIPIIKIKDPKQPFFLVSVSTPDITKLNRNVFRYNIMVNDEIDLIIEDLIKQNINEVCVLYINDEYGLYASQYFEKKIKEKTNIRIIANETYGTDLNSYKNLVTKIIKKSVPVLILGYGSSYINIFKTFSNYRFKKVIYTDYSMFFDVFKNPLIGSNLKVKYITPKIDTIKYNDFCKIFKNRYNHTPNYSEIISYDIINLISILNRNNIPIYLDNIISYLKNNRVKSGFGYYLKMDKDGNISIPIKLKYEKL